MDHHCARKRIRHASSSNDGFALVYVVASVAVVGAIAAAMTMLPHPSQHVDAVWRFGVCAALAGACLAFQARRDPYLTCQYLIVVAALTAILAGGMIGLSEGSATLGWLIVGGSSAAIVTSGVLAFRMGRRPSPMRSRFRDADILEENDVQWVAAVGGLDELKTTGRASVELVLQNCVDAKRKVDVSFLAGRSRIGPEPSPKSPVCLPRLTEVELGPGEMRSVSIPMTAAPAFRIEIQAIVRGWGGRRLHPWRARGAQRSIAPWQTALFGLFGYGVFGGGTFLWANVRDGGLGDAAPPAPTRESARTLAT